MIFLISSIFVPASPPAVMTSGKVKNGRDPEPLKTVKNTVKKKEKTVKKTVKIGKKRKNSQIEIWKRNKKN